MYGTGYMPIINTSSRPYTCTPINVFVRIVIRVILPYTGTIY